MAVSAGAACEELIDQPSPPLSGESPVPSDAAVDVKTPCKWETWSDERLIAEASRALLRMNTLEHQCQHQHQRKRRRGAPAARPHLRWRTRCGRAPTPCARGGLDAQFIPAIEKGFKEMMASGSLCGSPVMGERGRFGGSPTRSAAASGVNMGTQKLVRGMSFLRESRPSFTRASASSELTFARSASSAPPSSAATRAASAAAAVAASAEPVASFAPVKRATSAAAAASAADDCAAASAAHCASHAARAL